ncbi:PKD domain-containing protein, partial [Mangrovimonas sp. TPBH4]|uniref:PKD domain-containing protein n=1 Tax=Mangrovimonas sp. TPBH4 TaxID=1645914 RepID=UPI000AA94D80
MKRTLLVFFLISSFVSFSQDLLMQDGTFSQCSGMFYDSGGAAGNYASGEDIVITICPENDGQLVQLNFTAFSTQLGADTMTIYDGDSVAADAFGTFDGANNPGFVTATPDNTSGCLTIQFVSNDSGVTTGWAAEISCMTPCQTVLSQLDSATPTPNADGYIEVCINEPVTVTGSGDFEFDGTGATYEWISSDGQSAEGQTATFSFAEPGVYLLNLNVRDGNTSVDPEGCANTNLINQVVQVAPAPDFTGTQAAESVLCFGESTTIDGVVNAVEYINECTPPVSGTTFLPDGSGAVYSTCITVDCFASDQTLTDANQLLDVCVNMEHSYSGDLDITIISPNGQEAELFVQAGGGTYFGGANDDNSNTPGVGADYCWSMSGTTLLQNAPTITAGSNPPGNSWAPGTYLPIESFASLIGSPLNGDWCIEIVDNLSIDNGYIFSWGMNFDPNIQPPELSFTADIETGSWGPDASIIDTTDNVITVQPTTAGMHCYTYTSIDSFGCEYSEEVCIEVLPEIVTEAPNNLYVCDNGAPPYIFNLESNTSVVLASAANQSELEVTFHESQQDADDDTNEISTSGAYPGTDGQTIYIRVEYLDSGCYEVLPFTLNVTGQPTINSVLDLELCDDISNDGFESFDLTVQDFGILGPQPGSDFLVTYYTSFAEADEGAGALVSPYTNTVNPQPIYVRVESVGDSNCYIASANPVFNLIVNHRAEAFESTDLYLCTEDASSPDQATFDLTSQDSFILGAQDPSVYTVGYYTSLTDAELAQGAIATPSAYGNTTNPQTIYVRVEDPAYPDCYGTSSFQLFVNPLPSYVDPTPLEVCDDNVPDGSTDIDLTIKNSEINGNNPGYSVSYYNSLADAESGANALAIPYFGMTGETVFVRIEDIQTGCYSTTTLELVVEQAPEANIPDALEYCDADSDGFGVFDLSDADAAITGGATGLVLTYHETFADADNGVNALSSPYNNIVANDQILYVRVESATIATDCATIVELALVVHPTPQ